MMREIKLKGLGETIYEYESECGLKVYVWQNEKVNSTLMTLSVHYGSIHTDFKIGNKTYHVPNGIAHFLEHVKFNVEENKTSHEIFYDLGADANAFTTFKYTSYVVYASKYIKENLEELLKFVYTPYFTKEIIEQEKDIITEEATMGEDDPNTIAFYDFYKCFFHNLKYKYRITGDPEEIQEITLEDIELIYNTFYHPENMFLCVTGNMNPYEVGKIVDDVMKNFTFKKFKKPKILEVKEDRTVAIKYLEEDLNIMGSRFKYGVKIPKSRFKNCSDLELRLYLNILLKHNFGYTSDFKEDLLLKNLATEFYVVVDVYEEYVGIIINAKTEYIKEVKKLVDEKLKRLEITEEVFERKKKGMLASIILQFEDADTVNTNIQHDLVLEGKIIDDVKDVYESLSIDKMKEIIKYITLDQKAMLVMKPKEN